MLPRRSQSTSLKRNPACRVVPTIHRWRSVVIHPYLYVALGLVVFLGTVQASKAIDFWTASGRVTGSGEAVTLSGNDPLEIKGWMTIEQVAAAYGVSSGELKASVGIPQDVPDTTELKQVEKSVPGFSTQQVRDWLLTRQSRR